MVARLPGRSPYSQHGGYFAEWAIRTGLGVAFPQLVSDKTRRPGVAPDGLGRDRGGASRSACG